MLAFVGALMLVEPHQFGSPVYAVLRANIELWGTAFLIAGAALLCATALVARPVVTVAAHTAAVAVMLLMVSGFAGTGGWTGVVSYGVLAIGTLLAVLRVVRNRPWGRGDLLMLTAGTNGLLLGLLMLLAPRQFGLSVYDSIRPDLALYGAAFVVTSLSLIAIEIHPIRGEAAKRVVHLLGGAMFLLFAVKIGLQTPLGIALYGGYGFAVCLQPWLAGRLPRIDPASLRVRSALMLVALVAVPLIGVVAILADQVERVATLQALTQQQTLAVALAADADDYIRLHSAVADDLALIPGLLDLNADARHSLLRDLAAPYPDVSSFSVFDADGRALGRSDDFELTAATGYPIFEDARRTNAPARRRPHFDADPSADLRIRRADRRSERSVSRAGR